MFVLRSACRVLSNLKRGCKNKQGSKSGYTLDVLRMKHASETSVLRPSVWLIDYSANSTISKLKLCSITTTDQSKLLL